MKLVKFCLYASACSISQSSLAATWIRASVRDLTENSDAVFVGTVVRLDTKTLDDGFVVTQARIEVKETLLGSVPTGKITLGLPVAWVDGRMQGFAGVPLPSVGDALVVFGTQVNATDVGMTAGPQSVFVARNGPYGDYASTFDGAPIIDAGCVSPTLRATAPPPKDTLNFSVDVPPSEWTRNDVSESDADDTGLDRADPDVAPEQRTPEVQAPAPAEELVSGDSVAADPVAAALPWDALLYDLKYCMITATGKASEKEIGGGW